MTDTPPDSQSTPQSTSEPAVPATPRERLRRSLSRRWSRGQAVVAVLLAVLGFAAVTQVRDNDREDAFTGARQSELIALINSLTLATERTQNELADLRRTRDALRDDTEASLTALSIARQRAEELSILAGTVPVIGPGIRITVTAERGGVGTEQLLNGLQELRDSGAEAIEVDDAVRVVAETSIVQTPNGEVAVGGVPLGATFVLDVIGNPETLAPALTFPGGFIVEIEEVGGSVEVEKSRAVEIASVRTPPQPRFAEPAAQE